MLITSPRRHESARPDPPGARAMPEPAARHHDADVALLLAVLDALEDAGEDAAFRALLAAHPGWDDALLAFLAASLGVPGAPPPSGGRPPRRVWDVVPALLIWLDDAHTDALFADVLFAAAHDALFPLLAPSLRLALPAARVEAAVVRALADGAPRARRNAVAVAAVVFSARSDYALSPAGDAAFEAARDAESG
ncbi:MAG: hypothetical protein KC635_29210 [Myxococcales bacterium]|nr:hypothetical protein [Myxococcales bacterium]